MENILHLLCAKETAHKSAGLLPALDDALLFANKAQRAEKGERSLMRMVTTLVGSLGNQLGSMRNALGARLLGLVIIVPAFILMMQISGQETAQGQAATLQIEPLQGATVSEARLYFEEGTIVGSGIDCFNASWDPRNPPLEGVATYGDGGGYVAARNFSCNEENPDRIHFTLDHVYADPGTYPVRVKIADDQGAIGTQTAQVTVTEATEESIDIEPLQGATVSEARPYFETGAIVIPGIECFNWMNSWDHTDIANPPLAGVATYGDEEGGGSRRPVTIQCDHGNNERVSFGLGHVYADPGIYPVKVKIADDSGAVGTATATVVVESATAPSDTNVTKEASAGETVSTAGETPTSDNLIITSVTTPNAGEVSIHESSTIEQQPPSGYTFFGQQVSVTTPSATTENPLVLMFSIDSSLVPVGTDPNSIQVFRNGTLVEECANPSASSAQPDPCVASKETLTGGDVAVTVRSSQASAWNFGVQEDTTAPTITTTDPQAGAKGVPRTTKVTAKFSEAVQAATLTSANAQLFSGNSTKPLKATLSNTSTSVTLTPSQRLDAKRRYTAKIKGGSTGVKDLAGNPLASDFSWSFTTGSK